MGSLGPYKLLNSLNFNKVLQLKKRTALSNTIKEIDGKFVLLSFLSFQQILCRYKRYAKR